MKTNLNYIKKLLLALIITLLFSKIGYSQASIDFTCSHISNYAIDKVNKTVKFKILMYHETGDLLSNDDNMIEFSFHVNNTRYFDVIAKTEYAPYHNGGTEVEWSIYGQNEDTWRVKNYHSDLPSGSLNISTTTGGGYFAYTDFTVPLLPADYYEDTYTLTFGENSLSSPMGLELSFDDLSTNFLGTCSKTIQNVWPGITLSNVTATDDNCSSINLGWTLNTGFADDVNYQVIYFDSSNQVTLQQGTSMSSYNYFLSNPEATTDTFSVNAGYGSNLVHAFTQKVTGGPPINNYFAPESFAVSDHTCDNIALSWDDSTSGDETVKYRITRSDGEIYYPLKGTSTLNIASDIDPIDYTFTIAALNTCDFDSIGATVNSTNTPLYAPSISTLTDVGADILVVWPDSATGASSFTIKKSFNGIIEVIDNIDPDSTSYYDDNVNFCVDYKYELIAVNDCDPNGESTGHKNILLSPDVGNSFNSPGNYFKGSKGYFVNRIELEWNNENNVVLNTVKIARKILGSSSPATNIAALTPGTQLYVDYTADAGQFYEYSIYGEVNCAGTTFRTDTVNDVGYRSASGIVSGHVDYTGGTAVPNVKINVEAVSTSGYSLLMTPSNYGEIPDTSDFDFTNAFTIEMYVKLPTASSDVDFVSKAGSFSLGYLNGTDEIEFEVITVSGTQNVLLTNTIDDDLYHQITAVYDGSNISLIIDGDTASVQSAAHTGNVVVTANNILIGSAVSGSLRMDELRFFNLAKPLLSIKRDYSRVLEGTESGLIAYYRFNENGGNAFYDISHVGAIYNENHAAFVGSPSFSPVIPLPVQLSFADYTNASGDYTVSVSYSGSGQAFNVVPLFPAHSFTPSNTSVYIGNSSQIQNGVNFEDLSSFTLRGKLRYAGTECPVKDAILKVDGNPVVLAGNPVMTDSDGNYAVQVPIGLHVVTIEKNDHFMSLGRFPVTGIWDFQEDETASFYDSTLVKVVGRAVGGLREAQYIPGLGQSVNNIGEAEIQFTPTQTITGCPAKTFYTDTLTGEYLAYLNPMNYTVSVAVIATGGPSFGAMSYDLTTVPAMVTEYDTLINDSIQYQKQLDFIHRVDPKIAVLDADDASKQFMGDKEFVYTTQTGNKDTLDLAPSSGPVPLSWALFDARGEGAEVNAIIRVFEEYTNFDNLKKDSVPTTDGTLIFENELAKIENHSVNMQDVNTLDSVYNLIYTFALGKANFNSNASIPQTSYTKALKIKLQTSTGTIIDWKPNNYTGTAFTPYDGTFRAYILGTKSEGAQFLTEGPKMPEYILRDPPGSNSFASREVGSTKSSENSWSWSLDGSTNSTDKILLGASFSVGLGVTVDTDINANAAFGFSTSTTGGESGTETSVQTNTEEWSTNAVEFSPGRSSDLYIGKSKNVTFGVSNTLTLLSTNTCNGTCVDSTQTNGGNFSFAINAGLSIVPGGYSTQFMYSEEDIKGTIIPALIFVRNTMLLGSSYSNIGNVNDSIFGLNNDDLRVVGGALSSADRIEYMMSLGDSLVTIPIINPTGVIENIDIYQSSSIQQAKWSLLAALDTSGFETLAGASYVYNAQTKQDSLTGDSVRWINNQIIHWENAIMLNEWEKVNIDNAALKIRLKNAELTKLYKIYENVISDYSVLNTGGIGAQSAAAALSLIPIPGAGLAAGVVRFSVGSASGIKAAQTFGAYTNYLLSKAAIESKFAGTPVNNSISGGVSYSSSMTHETASTVSRHIEYGMSTVLETEIGVSINGIGFGVERSVGIDYSSGRDWSTTSGTAETVAYTLYDQDQNDLFSVDVYPSLLGWGPIFKLRPGGRTACPYEGQLLTEYYLDDLANANSNPNYPSFELSAATQQIEKVEISSSVSLLTNIPIDNAAVFDLTLTNTSATNDDVDYRLRVDPASNPFGAYLKIDGSSPSIDVFINGGSAIQKVLTLEKGPGPVHNYDSILVIVHSLCQYNPALATDDFPDIVDSVYVSAHFIPGCTDVILENPDQNWVVNNDLNGALPIVIGDYDVNFFGFEAIELQYKPSSANNWIQLENFYVDTTGMNDTTALLISQSTQSTSWDWNTDQISDGNYDLRLISKCTLAQKISVIHSGIIDTQNPETFGTPSPGDGILDPNDDISIQFNEVIASGVLSDASFDVRGVKNRTASSPTESLNFDGSDYALVNGGANLKQRSFTLEFNAKSNAAGIDQVIFSQGTSALSSLTIGFDANDKMKFSLGNQSVTTNTAVPLSAWHHYAIIYDLNANAVSFYMDGGLLNTVSLITEYNGEGKLAFGKELASNSKYFNGNLRGIRLWNDARLTSEISANYTFNLQGNENGLLYNWRLDDIEGDLAIDHVRSRNADLFGTTWEVTPNGNAAQFDGVDDYLSIASSLIAINNEMDFTLEFWFKSSQATAATLFSNGYADGLQADSLSSWRVAKDAAGLIHIYHNGIDFVATNQNYFDDNWHHFSMILNRSANLTTYIDGNTENSIQATNFNDLAGGEMYIGAHGFDAGSSSFGVNDYFTGKLDEFRFWNTARKLEQIKRDRVNRILGDEFGLKLYIPFENYQILPSGTVSLTATTADQAIVPNSVANNGGVSLITETPSIRLPRPVKTILFNYSVNNDKIIITPTADPASIENVTLDITVKNIFDLNGNKMQSPETWIAYISKNQILWQDVEYDFMKTEDSTIVFTTNIVNSGGASKQYTIAGLPGWLSVDNATGTITPNSTQQVQFTIANGYSVGEYFADVTLTTDFGFDEILTINLNVVGEAPDWTVNPSDFAYNMILFGELEIDGIIATNPNSMLAAFINDTIVGVANLQYVSAYDRYEVFMNVYSNTVSGDSVSFEIYDASSGVTFVNVTPSLMFTENGVYGTVAAPITFQTTSTIALDIPLNSGWTWVSFPLETNQLSTTNLLTDGLSNASGDLIKGLFNYDQYDVSTAWIGGLSSSGGYTNVNTYKYNRTSEDTLNLVGKRIHPDSSNAQINLTQGWNWIGFVSTKVMDLGTALGQYTAATGDIIKSQYEFAYYDNSLGWIGSLTSMNPGLGYMLQAVNAGSFTYPLSTFYGKTSSPIIADLVLPQHYVFTPEQYSKTMSVVATGNICTEVLESNNVILVAEDNTGNIRGYASPTSVGNAQYFFITLYSNVDNEILSLKYVNIQTGVELLSSETIQFENNQLLGSISAAVQVDVDEESSCEILTSTEEVLANTWFSCYPNPFNEKVTVDFEKQFSGTVTLTDNLGRTVYREQVVKVVTTQIDLSGNSIPIGIYTMKISGEIESIIKLVKIK